MDAKVQENNPSESLQIPDEKMDKWLSNKLEKAIPLWKQAQKQVTKYMGNNRFNDFLTELNYVEKIPSV